MMILALILTKLRSRPTQADLAECRNLLVRHMGGKSDAVPMGRDQAERLFLEAAAVLATHGASEPDLRDLLDDESACLHRSGCRRQPNGGQPINQPHGSA